MSFLFFYLLEFIIDYIIRWNEKQDQIFLVWVVLDLLGLINFISLDLDHSGSFPSLYNVASVGQRFMDKDVEMDVVIKEVGVGSAGEKSLS